MKQHIANTEKKYEDLINFKRERYSIRVFAEDLAFEKGKFGLFSDELYQSFVENIQNLVFNKIGA